MGNEFGVLLGTWIWVVFGCLTLWVSIVECFWFMGIDFEFRVWFGVVLLIYYRYF